MIRPFVVLAAFGFCSGWIVCTYPNPITILGAIAGVWLAVEWASELDARRCERIRRETAECVRAAYAGSVHPNAPRYERHIAPSTDRRNWN